MGRGVPPPWWSAAVRGTLGLASLASTPDGGYWMAGTDGGVCAFGDAPYLGSVPGAGVQVDDVAFMAAP